MDLSIMVLFMVLLKHKSSVSADVYIHCGQAIWEKACKFNSVLFPIVSSDEFVLLQQDTCIDGLQMHWHYFNAGQCCLFKTTFVSHKRLSYKFEITWGLCDYTQ